MASLITADLHFSANPRDAYRLRWGEKDLPALLRKERVDRLIILGDLTSEKDHHGAWLTNKVVTIIRAAAQICPVYILQGNHDASRPTNPFFEFLGRYQRVYWIKSIIDEKLDGLGYCLFIPHQRKLEAWQNIKQLKEEWNWVFTHATFDGAKNEQDMPLTGAPAGLVLGHRVVSGDVHVPQKHGPVTYVGPPFRINFGDTYLPRVLLLTEHHMNQRNCEGPRKVLLEVDGWEMLEAAADDGLAVAGDIVKVRYEIAAQDYDKWPAIRCKIESWAAGLGIELDSALPVPRPTSGPPRANTGPSRAAPVSDEAIMKAYCERYRVGDKTLRLGLKLMEKAG